MTLVFHNLLFWVLSEAEDVLRMVTLLCCCKDNTGKGFPPQQHHHSAATTATISLNYRILNNSPKKDSYKQPDI